MKLLVTLAASSALLFACTKSGSNNNDQAESAAVPGAAVPAQAIANADDTAPAEADPTCGGDGFCCGGEGGEGAAGEAAPSGPVPDDAVWATLEVDGLRCDRCAAKIKTSLGKLDGVLSVTVDRKEDGTGQVKVAAAANTEGLRDRLAPHISELGYRVVN